MNDFDSYEYQVVEVVQQPDSPPFYLAAVPATELLEWCDVPRVKGDFMAGYQRILESKRTGAVRDYLDQSPNNIIPGAVIVAVDSDYADLDSEKSTLKVAKDQRDFDTKLLELFGAFTTRMSEEELDSATISWTTVTEGTGDEDEEDQDQDQVDPPSSDDESTYPRSYLAVLAKELQQAIDNWHLLDTERQQAITSYIEGTSKPGLIIDGQHRVFGAKDVSRHNVFLPVVIIPGLSHSEQVFQFYTLNSTAKPLKPTELRRIVSTSLAEAEIEDLYHRFKQAGLEVNEAQWTFAANTDSRSPFRGLIDFGLGSPGEVIRENVADQLVRAFMKMNGKKYGQLIEPVESDWRDDQYRLERFFWFWSAISSEYQEVWDTACEAANKGEQPGSGGNLQIFMKVGLLTLQSFVLDRILLGLPFRRAEPPPFSSREALREVVKAVLENLPAEFFSREWRAKQMDTSEGRDRFYSAMQDVANESGNVDGRKWPFRAQV